MTSTRCPLTEILAVVAPGRVFQLSCAVVAVVLTTLTPSAASPRLGTLAVIAGNAAVSASALARGLLL